MGVGGRGVFQDFGFNKMDSGLHIWVKLSVELHCSFFHIYFVLAKFAIVEPFPLNIYPIEYTSTQVTCVAYDDNDASPVIPKAIQFVRKDKFAVLTNLTANDNIYFTNRTEGRYISCNMTAQVVESFQGTLSSRNSKISLSLFPRHIAKYHQIYN